MPADRVHENLGRYMLVDGMDIVLDLEKSKGAMVHDARSGRDFVDFFSFFASQPIGMNHPRMCNQETIEYLGRAALHKPSNSDVYTVEMAEYVETFGRVAVPKSFKHLFFIEGGGLAVENALKTAFDWKYHKNKAKGIDKEGSKIIHFRHCFHGRTGYTMSLTDSFDLRKTAHFPKFDWPRITTPWITFPLEGENLKAVEAAETQAIAEIHQALQASPHEIAGLIIEPIQGEGGDNHFRGEFFEALRKICDENEILLIFDEVQSGLGLTGKMWAFQHFNITPDIVCFGKKTQVCGIMVTGRIDDVDNVFKVSSRLNSTWGGNFVDMIRSRLHLEIIEEEKLVDRARTSGEILLGRFQKLQAELGGGIENARGRGLMCAFSVSDGFSRKEMLAKIYENGVIALPCGRRSIRVRPSLDISREVLEAGIDKIEAAIKTVVAAGKA
ncbi:MAG: L-lysine 6-transaminase [Candidatus Eisenbacteria bacterium]|uniref:L-lysine-epsilon aminotransferase n=1 Tax=Eiseniibacteriota bacterium TaxID=2212470 RepID=A0A948RTX0_UNCEI|nr:L-lysine 6-transaminase [Candidatus Eisenbacteria bacterium]MBU1950530.1 L-lysine 6-transaminase [Candidatus Eisenbacteria bacterium]MBU2690935.1 L-lysine 6-transaminase [Candidatus Eisenbacteria bacterium]